MRKLFFGVFLFCCVCLNHLHAQQNKPNESNGLVKGAADRFTGNVWVQFFVNDTITDFLASKVIFEPNARSNWHFHQGKQIIFCVEGSGFYKEKGKPITILKKGDLVTIEPLTVHSHGSLKTSKFTQVVLMNGINLKDATTWLQKVTEEEIENE